MPDDMKFDDFLREAAKDYNAPVTPPSDAMWAAIEPDVLVAIRTPGKTRRAFITTSWIGLSIAATLVIGVAVGRWTAPESPVARPPIAVRPTNDSAGGSTQARAVTLEHLAEAEVFLTSVRAELKSGQTDADRAERSRDLLVRTRVLLGASRNRSPEVERLLQDLELLLAEIAALPSSGPSLDRTLLDESMRDGNIIPRIRATLPTRPRAAGA